MITLYKKKIYMRNITSLLYGFNDCREIKINRKIGTKELRSIANDVTKIMIDPIFSSLKMRSITTFPEIE